MKFIKKILRENVKPHSESERMICRQLDKSLFDTLTEKEKISYQSSFEPIKNSDLYNFVATYKLQ